MDYVQHLRKETRMATAQRLRATAKNEQIWDEIPVGIPLECSTMSSYERAKLSHRTFIVANKRKSWRNITHFMAGLRKGAVLYSSTTTPIRKPQFKRKNAFLN